jgi:rhomboid family GlyGly-CTERM serine protease
LLLNLLAVFLLWALHGQYFNQKHYLCLFLGISLGTSLGLYCFAPSLRWYVGLSGVLHGLFIVGAYFDITHQYRTSWLLLIGVWVKVIDEQLSGASDSISALIEANVAIDAHLYGTFCGSIVILGYVVKHRIKNR